MKTQTQSTGDGVPTLPNDISTCKRCCKCKEAKPLSEFYTNKRKVDGRNHTCINCDKIRHKGKQNKAKLHLSGGLLCSTCDAYLPLHAFGLDKTRRTGYSKLCLMCTRAKNNANYAKRHNLQPIPDDHKKCSKCKVVKHVDHFGKQAGRKATSHCLACRRQHYKDNADAIRSYAKSRAHKTLEYKKKRYHTDPRYKLTCTLRNRFREAIKKNFKRSSVLDLVGCSMEELKQHLESQFKQGMTWNNHGVGDGKWHIDHIIPLSVFDDPQSKQAWSKDNLQPLWGSENCSKGGGSRYLSNQG